MNRRERLFKFNKLESYLFYQYKELIKDQDERKIILIDNYLSYLKQYYNKYSEIMNETDYYFFFPAELKYLNCTEYMEEAINLFNFHVNN